MAKQRKIVRTKNMYKVRKPRSKAVGTLLFILLLIVLIALGFIINKEWQKRFGKNAPVSSIEIVKPPQSVGTSSDEISSSEPVSSENNLPQTANFGKAIAMPKDTAINATLRGAFINKAKTDGYSAVYVTLKDNDGMISYATTNEMAIKYGAVSETTFDIKAVVDEIKNAGLKPIANISALKDPKAAHVRNENSYGYGDSTEVNWLDNSVKLGGKAWLNPYMQNTRDYISALTKEAQTAGFEVVVLENVMFPDKNTVKMNIINEGTTSHADILAQLVQEAQAAAGTVPVYYGFNAVSVATHANYAETFSSIKTQNIAPQINMQDIIAKQYVIAKALFGDGYDKAITASDVAKALIEKATNGSEKNVLPILQTGDEVTLKSTLEAKNIKNYVLK